jgi:hypothetical protein
MAACCTNSRAAPDAATCSTPPPRGAAPAAAPAAPAHPAGAAAAGTSPAPPARGRPPAARPPPRRPRPAARGCPAPAGPGDPQVPGHRIGGGPVAGHVQAVGDGLPHHPGIAHSRQRDEEHTVRERLIQRGRRGQRQPRLADPAGAGQRHQPDLRPAQRGADLLQVVVPADQRRQRHRQPARRAQALQRRELAPPAQGRPAGRSAPAPRCPSAGESPDPAPTHRRPAAIPPASRVASDSTTCPPCAAAAIRAARCTSMPT